MSSFNADWDEACETVYCILAAWGGELFPNFHAVISRYAIYSSVTVFDVNYCDFKIPFVLLSLLQLMQVAWQVLQEQPIREKLMSKGALTPSVFQSRLWSGRLLEP